jgi:hypothetical protein
MAAGFECDVRRSASGGLARTLECIGFCMGFARALMPAFSDDLTVPHQYAADAWIRRGGVQAKSREP